MIINIEKLFIIWKFIRKNDINNQIFFLILKKDINNIEQSQETLIENNQ